ncbi:MAG TPA: MCP four helix bundle domain-containing protein, partial [Candidatus Acidoferrum sp.]|nr:MCP four helix bundle domain-containing protein [Candidatus Acidoferrum sp.]
MKFLRNMRVGSRLAIGFGVLAVAMIVVGIFGVARVSRLNRELDQTVNVRMKAFTAVTRMLEDSHHDGRYRSQMFLEADPIAVEWLLSAQKADQKRDV